MIVIGTSGYDHPDWVGQFYGEGTRRDDFLKLYAEEFGMVELASTYFSQPEARETASLQGRVPAAFVFTALVHQSLVAGDLDEAGRFRDGVRPISESGQLVCVVACFPPVFRKCDENQDRLLRLRDALAGLQLVVEFTSGSWIAEGMPNWLRGHGLGYSCVDLPRLPGLAQPVCWVTGPIGYARFRGRNRPAWERGATEAERHDYSYEPLELAEWLPKVEEMDNLVPLTLLCLCNTPRAQAVASARILRRMIAAD